MSRLKKYTIAVCVAGLFLYGLAISLDLPRPAGSRYQQNLPNNVLIEWGAVPSASAVPAPNWLDKTQGLRGWSNNPEGWNWAKLGPIPAFHWFLLILLGVLGGIGLVVLERRQDHHPNRVPAAALLILILFSYVFQLLALQMKSTNPEQLLLNRVADNSFTGYFNSALRFDHLNDYFSNYVSTLKNPAYCSHCKTHPPGPELFYWSIHQMVNALPVSWQELIFGDLNKFEQLKSNGLSVQDVMVALAGANIILLLAATIVIPLYGIGRRLGSSKFALPLASLGVVIPGIVLMSPEFDQIYAVFSAWLLYLAIRGLTASTGRFLWGLAAGLLFAFCLFWSIGLAVLAIPLILFVPVALRGQLVRKTSGAEQDSIRLTPGSALRWLLGLSLGCAIPWILLICFGRFPILDLARAVRNNHLHGVTEIRPYFPWLVFNLVDFIQFLGIPLAFTTFLLLIKPVKRDQTRILYTSSFQSGLGRIGFIFEWILARTNIYSVIFWLVIFALNLSGVTRGEVGRLWIFLMPIALLPLFDAAGRGQLTSRQLHFVILSQFFVCLLIGGNWLTP